MAQQVTVGGVKLQPTGSATPMLMYNPETVMAAVGDTVEFMFMQMNHSVTQSTFAAPCNKMAGGMDSGFMPNPSGEVGKVTWQMKVTTTDPVCKYTCRATNTLIGSWMLIRRTRDVLPPNRPLR